MVSGQHFTLIIGAVKAIKCFLSIRTDPPIYTAVGIPGSIRLTTITVYLILAGVLISVGHGQEKVPVASGELTVAAIVDSLLYQYNLVEDYRVNVKISVKMPRLRMPNKKIKLYYKKPDKIKIEADGFAVVPRTGLTLSPAEIIDNLYNTRITGSEILGSRQSWIIEGSLHPDSLKFNLWKEAHDSVRVKMRLWVDGEGWVINRAETRIDTVTVMAIRSTYEQFDGNIWLPTLTELSFFLSGEYLNTIGSHGQMGGPFSEGWDANEAEGEGGFQGRVRMEYSRYKINRGIKDKIFRESDL